MLPSSDTKTVSGVPEDMEPETEKDELSSSSDTEWGSRVPESMEPESEKDELLPSDTKWGSGETQEMELELKVGDLSTSSANTESGGHEDIDPATKANPHSQPRNQGTPVSEEFENKFFIGHCGVYCRLKWRIHRARIF